MKQERNEVLSHNYGACKNAKKRNTISFAVAMCVYVNVGFCLFSTNCDGFLFEIVKMKRAHFVVRRLKFARIPKIGGNRISHITRLHTNASTHISMHCTCLYCTHIKTSAANLIIKANFCTFLRYFFLYYMNFLLVSNRRIKKIIRYACLLLFSFYIVCNVHVCEFIFPFPPSSHHDCDLLWL